MLWGLILWLHERFDRWKKNPYDTKLPSIEAFNVSPKCAEVEQGLRTISKNFTKSFLRCVEKRNSRVHVCIALHC